MSFKVVRKVGSVSEDVGVRGSYRSCAEWCEGLDWVDQDMDGFIWFLAIEEDR